MAQTGFNINSFKAQIESVGLLKNSKFLCRVGIPAGFSGNPSATQWSNTSQYMEFWCESSALPGVSLQTHNILRYGYGPIEKRPFMPIFNDINMSILSDAQGNNQNFWKSWIQLISNFQNRKSMQPGTSTTQWGGIATDPYELSYRDEYVSDISMQQFDDAGNLAIAIILREAFPVFVGDQIVNWGMLNDISRIPVSVSFVDWYWDDDTMNSAQQEDTTQPTE